MLYVQHIPSPGAYVHVGEGRGEGGGGGSLCTASVYWCSFQLPTVVFSEVPGSFVALAVLVALRCRRSPLPQIYISAKCKYTLLHFYRLDCRKHILAKMKGLFNRCKSRWTVNGPVRSPVSRRGMIRQSALDISVLSGCM